MGRSWLFAWGLAAVAFGGASLIVPLYVVELGGGAFVLGVLFATASFVGVPGALVFGNLADRTGKRRPFVLAALVVATATTLVIPTLESVPLVIAANAALCLGFAAAVPVLTLLAVSGEPEHRWTAVIARLNEYQGIGWAAGLGLGFVVTAVVSLRYDPVTAQRAFLFVCAASAAAGLALAARALPPDSGTVSEPSPTRLRRRVREASRFNVRGAAFPFTPARFDPRGLRPRVLIDRFSPALATYFAAVLVVFTGFGVFFAPLPAYLAGVGFGSSETFALYFALNAAAAAFYGRAGRLAGRTACTRYTPARCSDGVALPTVAVVGVAGGSTLFALSATGAAFVAIGVTWAAIAVTAAALVTRLAPPAIRGEALGAYGALVAVGGGFGGIVGGWLASSDTRSRSSRPAEPSSSGRESSSRSRGDQGSDRSADTAPARRRDSDRPRRAGARRPRQRRLPAAVRRRAHVRTRVPADGRATRNAGPHRGGPARGARRGPRLRRALGAGRADLLAPVRRRRRGVRPVGAALARGRPHRGGRARHVERRPPPLRHPIHLAKSAATVDRLSDGRVVLGVASGDRDPEYAAFGVDPEKRGEMVRERIAAMRACWREDFPEIDGEWGELGGDLDVLPKPTTETLPVLPTGNARQSTEWIAEHGDGWLFYHLPDETLRSYVAEWRELAGAKPFSIAVGVEFADDPTAEPEPLHLGYRAGVDWFREYFRRLDEFGVDHVVVDLRGDDPETAMETFADEVSGPL